jgi:hypothetical protein
MLELEEEIEDEWYYLCIMKYQKRFCERAVFINLTFRKLVMNFGF